MKFTFAPESRPLSGYTIKRAIDRGGFGEVYYALSDAGKEVALKLLQHNLDVELRGVRQCLNLRHPNLVTIFDIRTDEDEDHWIVMEYAGGQTLEQVLAEHPQGLPPAEALRWIQGVAAGVEFLHTRGLVHRDLKPGNIFADQGTVKVGDVGLSKFITPSRRSAQTESVGTVHYMAPEVSRGRYGPEVDVYAAGILLVEMLTGKVPFNGESTAEILMKHLTATPDLSQISPGLRPLLERALDKDPARRLGSIQEIAQGLEHFVAGKQPIVETRPSITIAEENRRRETVPPPLPQETVLETTSAAAHADELSQFWHYVGLFFRPEMTFVKRAFRNAYRIWKTEIPVYTRWPVAILAILFSPVLTLAILALTPSFLFISALYFGIREILRVAIWISDPPPGTHPWTRLFGGKHSTFAPLQPSSPPSVTPAPVVATHSFSPSATPLTTVSVASTTPPEPALTPSSDQITEQSLSFYERWLGIPLLALAGFAGLLILDNLRDNDFIQLFWMIVVISFLISLRITSHHLNKHAVSNENRKGINLLLFSLAGFTTLLGFSGIEVLDVAPLLRFNDEVMVGSLLSIGGGLASFLLIRRRFSLTAPIPHMPATVQQSTPTPAFFGFGRVLLITSLLLLAIGSGSMLLATFAPQFSTINVGNVVPRAALSMKLPWIILLIPMVMGTAAFFLLRRSPSPIHSEAPPVKPVPQTLSNEDHLPPKKRPTEFWLITGFLTVWFAVTSGWIARIPIPASSDGTWLGLIFYPNTWTGLSLLVWAQILILALLIGRLVPRIQNPVESDPDPQRSRLRLLTGYLQSLLWSFLLAAGFTLTILGLGELTSSTWSKVSPSDLNASTFLHLVWLFSFLSLSSVVLLTQSYLRTRFGFLESSRFFTLIISGLLFAAVRTTLDRLLGPIVPVSLPQTGSPLTALELYIPYLQFFLPILVLGGWMKQISLARDRRFRLSRLIWVSLLTQFVCTLLGYPQNEFWVFLMASLSCIVQLGAPWSDPDKVIRPVSSPSPAPSKIYSVSLVQGA